MNDRPKNETQKNDRPSITLPGEVQKIIPGADVDEPTRHRFQSREPTRSIGNCAWKMSWKIVKVKP